MPKLIDFPESDKQDILFADALQEEDPNLYHDRITEDRLFSENFVNSIFEEEEVQP